MMQQAIVAVVVLVAAFVVGRRYAPRSWKAFCTGLAARTSRRLGWNALAARLEEPAPSKPDCASGCATCAGCDLVKKTPAGEYVILLERLKRP